MGRPSTPPRISELRLPGQRFSWPVLVASIPLCFAGLLALTFFGSPKLAYRSVLILSHVVTALVAIAFGGFQFVQGLRKHWLSGHRWAGRLYVISTAINSSTAVVIAAEKSDLDLTSFGLVLTTALWFMTTAIGFTAIRRKSFALHRQWMMRSYALALTAISLRVYEHGFVHFGIQDAKLVHVVSVFGALFTNVAIAEIIIRRGRRHRELN